MLARVALLTGTLSVMALLPASAGALDWTWAGAGADAFARGR